MNLTRARERLLPSALLLVALACSPPAHTSPRPSSRSLAAAEDSGAPAASATGTLLPLRAATASSAAATFAIVSEAVPLRIAPIDAATFRDATARRSSDGKYALEAEFDTFRVLAVPSRRVVARGSGRRAQWTSPTEIAFLHEQEVTKLDVASADGESASAKPRKARTSTGGRACCAPGTACRGVILPCGGSSSLGPAVLEWVNAELEHALVSTAPFAGLYDVRPNEIVRVMESPVRGEIERDRVVLAGAVSKRGGACTLAVARGVGPAQAQLDCAEPAWGPARRIRELDADGPLGDTGLGAVQLRFFSETEVLVSLPLRADVVDGRATSFRHCVVTLATAAARCTTSPRPRWWPVGDGRFVVEQNVSAVVPGNLIDTVRGRSWSIGSDPRAAWFWPEPDARDPRGIVFWRADKADEQWGALTLPMP